MDENHQDKTGSKLIATEDVRWVFNKRSKLWTPKHKKPFVKRMGFAGKTPWDFIQLLLIPLVLAGVGFLFSAQQNQTSLQVSERQHRADLQIAATRYANDQQLAADQQRETTLKTYLDDMSDLLLNHNLRKSKSGDEVSQVARERTLTALRRLDANRNGIVLQFLQDAHLIGTENPIIDFGEADLSGDNLSYVNLSYVNLSYAYLSNADLSYATLSYATLSYADLEANLSNADLYNANLSGAILYNANLSDANLEGANLSGAILYNANLSNADLSGAIVTQEQLARAKSLQGATMPDGSKHP